MHRRALPWLSPLLAALVLTLAAPAPLRAAETLVTIRAVAFAGVSNWPIWAAQQHGFFARRSVAVDLDFTPGSAELARNLAAGRYDVALTAIDNIVAYDEGEGEVALPERPDFVAFMGVDDGLLNLMAKPEIASVAALRGRTLSVDAMTTGYAFVLREIVARAGLAEGEVRFERAGGGAQRLAALKAGKQDATLLNTPLDLLAETAGFRRLAVARQVIGPYQGIVGAARRAWAKDHAGLVIAFMRGYRDGIVWLEDLANRKEAVAILQSHLHGATPAEAKRIAEVLLAPHSGFIRDLAIDRAGMATVLRLRSKYAEPRRRLRDPRKYIDLSYRRLALGAAAR
jgi:ABC-type nitrate/sulfonate/bicarbonate transport system substrate-binding protein